MGNTRSTAATNTRAPARRGGGHGSPAMLILLGLLAECFALLVITLQTQTNEAFVNGTQQATAVIEAQWTIWLQIPKLCLGSVIPGPPVTSNDLPSIVIGQGTELVYLILVTAFEVAIHSSKKWGRIVGAIIFVFMVGISLFDFYSDYTYGNVSGATHFIFAVFCTVVVGFFPTLGLELIRQGWQRS